jgi:hypothetical protein
MPTQMEMGKERVKAEIIAICLDLVRWSEGSEMTVPSPMPSKSW